jgi:hypothetical protein
MPNWTTNKLKITRNPYDMERKSTFSDIAEFVKGVDGCFDFNKVIPKPGDVDWYSWCMAKWGTKWNAHQARVTEYESSLVYEFLTAWSPPLPVIQALSDIFHDFIFDIVFFSEDFGADVGRFVFCNGHGTTVEAPEDFSNKAYEMIEKHFPGAIEERGYALNPDTGKYEYLESECEK